MEVAGAAVGAYPRLALSVLLIRFTPRVSGSSAFLVGHWTIIMKMHLIIPLLLLAGYFSVNAQTNAPSNIPFWQKPIMRDRGSGGTPIGTLNYPIGSYLTIEGVKAKQDPMVMANQDLCRVERVNGSKLSQPVTIKIDEARGWSNGIPFVFKGYETFRMFGTPPAEYFAAREAGNKDFIGTQEIWRLEFYFVVTSVVAPKEERH